MIFMLCISADFVFGLHFSLLSRTHWLTHSPFAARNCVHTLTLWKLKLGFAWTIYRSCIQFFFLLLFGSISLAFYDSPFCINLANSCTQLSWNVGVWLWFFFLFCFVLFVSPFRNTFAYTEHGFVANDNVMAFKCSTRICYTSWLGPCLSTAKYFIKPKNAIKVKVHSKCQTSNGSERTQRKSMQKRKTKEWRKRESERERKRVDRIKWNRYKRLRWNYNGSTVIKNKSEIRKQIIIEWMANETLHSAIRFESFTTPRSRISFSDFIWNSVGQMESFVGWSFFFAPCFIAPKNPWWNKNFLFLILFRVFFFFPPMLPLLMPLFPMYLLSFKEVYVYVQTLPFLSIYFTVVFSFDSLFAHWHCKSAFGAGFCVQFVVRLVFFFSLGVASTNAFFGYAIFLLNWSFVNKHTKRTEWRVYIYIRVFFFAHENQKPEKIKKVLECDVFFFRLVPTQLKCWECSREQLCEKQHSIRKAAVVLRLSVIWFVIAALAFISFFFSFSVPLSVFLSLFCFRSFARLLAHSLYFVHSKRIRI